MRVTDEGENQSAKLCQKLPAIRGSRQKCAKNCLMYIVLSCMRFMKKLEALREQATTGELLPFACREFNDSVKSLLDAPIQRGLCPAQRDAKPSFISFRGLALS
jgi:hypothetical protein